MSESSLIVVDWTSSVLEIGVFSRSLRGYELRSSFTLPSRMALREETQGDIICLFGADVVDEEDNEHTILFRSLGRELPFIEDTDLQTELLRNFWQGLYDYVIRKGALSEGEVAPVYLIPPARFPQPLLDRVRICAGQTPLRLCSTPASATALVMGALRPETFVEDLTRVGGSDRITAGCFVLKGDFIEGVCFDYQTPGPDHHKIVIRDHFQVTSDKLAARLSDFSDLNILLVVEDAECSNSLKGRTIAALQQVTGAPQCKRRTWSSEVSLKLKGCAELASFATGQFKPGHYEISHVYNLGVKINQSRFYPLIAREQLKSGKFPTAGSQSFRLSRKPDHSLRLNFCGGYSTSIAESISLGSVVLSESELNAPKGHTYLAAFIRLDTPGSGEFFLGLMPENRILRRQSFMLPGLA